VVMVSLWGVGASVRMKGQKYQQSIYG
jgi:hypothetical protein